MSDCLRKLRAFEIMKDKLPDLLVLDIWLEGSDLDGIEILERMNEDHPGVPVVVISGHGNVETAVSAIKLGAYDFIEKLSKADRLLLTLNAQLRHPSCKKKTNY